MVDEGQFESMEIIDTGNVPPDEDRVKSQYMNGSPGVKYFKVCEHCGRTFNKKAAYIQHANSHRPLQQCVKCNFKTKDAKKFRLHMDSHKKSTAEVQCVLCSVHFDTILNRRAHKKSVHNLYECNYCSVDYISERKMLDHIQEIHMPKKNVYVAIENAEDGESSAVSPNSLSNVGIKIPLVCRLCNKQTRNKYQLKIHLAQHLGVSSNKITDDDLLSDVRQSNWDEENDSFNSSEYVADPESVNSEARNIETSNMSKSLTSKKVQSSYNEPTSDEDYEVELPDDQMNCAQSLGNLTVKEEPIELDLTQKQDTQENFSELRAESKDLIRPWLPCDQCGDSFTTLKALRKHQKAKHRRKAQCPACGLVRFNTKKLISHQKTCHKDKLRCHFHCLALFDTREQLSSHHLRVHNKDDSKLVCRYCRQNYPRGTYMEHLLQCEEDPMMRRTNTCRHCHKTFDSPDDLTSHIKVCPSIPEPEIEPLENESNDVEEIPQKEDLQSENPKATISQTEELPKTDEETLPDLITPVPLKEPTRRVRKRKVKVAQHEAGLQKCKYCSKTFDTVEEGVDHVLCAHKVLVSNFTKEPRMCHVCGKTFLSGLALCKHILKHYNENGWWDALVPSDLNMETVRSVCWICKTKGMVNHRYHATRRDNYIEKLLTTRYTEPEEKDYLCTACNESFPDRYIFWKHIKLHMSKAFFKNAAGGKRFQCSRCPLKFLKKSQLYGHLATHLLEPHSAPQDEQEYFDESDDDDDDTEESRVSFGETKNSLENKLMIKHAIIAGKSSTSQVPQKCKRCHRKFGSLEDAVKHVFSTHKPVLGKMIEDTQSCHVCDKTFMKPMILCKHLLLHYQDLNMMDDLVPRDLLKKTNDRRYCWICNNMLGRKASRHINMRNNLIEQILKKESTSEEEEFPCSICDEVSPSRFQFWKHIALHMYKFPKKVNTENKVNDSSVSNSTDTTTSTLQCSDCLLKFDNKAALNKHIATHFLLHCTGELLEDEKIDQIIDSIPKVEKKLPVRIENKPDKEDKVNTIRLRKKVSVPSHSKYSQQCLCCSEVFENMSDAKRHVISVHKNEITETIAQPQKCHLCGITFKSQWCLCKHISKHYSDLGMWDTLVPQDLLVNYDLSQCWICKGHLGKKYTDHTNKRNTIIVKLMSAKMNQMERDVVFNCPVCNGTFKGRLSFWRHTNLHLSKGPIKLKARKKQPPPQPQNINDHERHIFSCGECSRFFVDEKELFEHLATHFLCVYDENEIMVLNPAEDLQANIGCEKESGSGTKGTENSARKRKSTPKNIFAMNDLDCVIVCENQDKKRFKSRVIDEESSNSDSEMDEDLDYEETDDNYCIETEEEVETEDEVLETDVEVEEETDE